MTRLTLVAAALFAALVLMPSRSEAGFWWGTYPFTSCSKNADGSGSCQGSALSFHLNSDANAYFYIQGVQQKGYAPWAYFSASLNGAYYSCMSPDSAMAEKMIALTNHGNVFTLQWDSTGYCTSVTSWLLSYAQ